MNERITKALGERFSFTLKNTTGAMVVVAIIAACFDTLALTEGAPNVKKYSDASAIVGAGRRVIACVNSKDGLVILIAPENWVYCGGI